MFINYWKSLCNLSIIWGLEKLGSRETRVPAIFAGCYYCKDLKRFCNTLQDSPVWQVFFLPVCLCITAILSTEGISPVHHRPMPLTNWQCNLGHKPLGIDLLQVILYSQIAQKIWQPARSMIRHINQEKTTNSCRILEELLSQQILEKSSL